MSRPVTLLLIALVAFPAASAAQNRGATFKELRQRALAERSAPAGRRLATIGRIASLRTPQARRFLMELFHKEEQPRVQESLLRHIGSYENKAVAKLLGEQLTKGADRLKRIAAYGLLNQERPGVQTLLRALGSPRAPVRSAALTALTSATRRPEVVSGLMAAVDKLAPQEQRRVLIALRGQPKSAAFSRFLVKLIDSRDVRTQAEALRSLSLGSPAELKKSGVKAKVIQKARNPSLLKNRAMRGAVFFALCAIADADTMPPMLEIAMEGDAMIDRELAFLARLAKPTSRLVKALRNILTKSEKAVERLVAVEVLSRFKTKEADRALVRALSDHSTAVVLAAMGPIARREVRAAVPYLKKIFQGNHPELRLEAMMAIHSVMKRDPSWPKQLMEQLESPKVGLRCAAIDLLGEMKYEKALPRVQGMAAAQEWQVRSAVYGFLGKVRARSSIQILITALSKENGRLQNECMTALVALTHRTYHKVSLWQRWWTAAAKDFELPDDPKVAKGKKGKKDKGAPGLPAAVTYYDIPVVSKRTCFLLDVSGSMAQKAGTSRNDTKIQHAKAALIQVIKGSDPDLHFNLVPFEGVAYGWAKSLQKMTKPNRLEAISFTKLLKPRGATNVYGALKKAFDDMSVDTIYLLSDGAPTVGDIRDIEDLADAVRRWNRDRRIIIHTISFGRDSKLLQRLAEESGGKYVRFV